MGRPRWSTTRTAVSAAIRRKARESITREKYPRMMIDRAMIVVAAGSSVRFGEDKMLTPVAGRPLVAHTVAAVVDHVDHCVLVCRTDQIPALVEMGLGVELVPGGPTRTASEMAGLDGLGSQARLIGIHDGARPMVPSPLIEILFETAALIGGAVPVVEPAHPIVTRSDSMLVEDVWVAQTPQVFRGEALIAAYAGAAAAGYQAQDTAEIARRFGRMDIEAVPGDPHNIKVTLPADLELVRTALEAFRTEPR